MSMLNVQIYIQKIRHLLSGVIFRFLPNLLPRFGRNRNITPDNKCLIFCIYIYIYIYIYILLFGSHTNPIFITAFTILTSTQGHRVVCNEVGSQSQAKHLLGFEPVTFL